MTARPIMPAGALNTRAAACAMAGIALVTMLVAFDQTVVGTALPRIVADLNGFALYAWVATAYLLLSSIFVPIMGRLGDLYGRKRFVLASIVIFTLASALCGLSQSMLQLVLSRALQGVGGGMLVGTAFAATADIFPDQLRRIKWQAVLSSAFGIANAVGPSLGGALTEHLGWRSVFYVNLPVGIAAFAVVARFLPTGERQTTANVQTDYFGAGLLALTIATFLLALEDLAQAMKHPESLWQSAALLIAGGALATGFLWSQRRSAHPIMPLRLFKIRAVSLLSLIGVASGMAMFSLVFYAPLLLQAGFGLSPNRSGILVSPLVVFISVGSIANGRLYGRMPRPWRLLKIGVGLFLAGLVCVLAVRGGVPVAFIAGAFAIAGLGLGFQLPNLTIQMQAAVARADIGVASALVQTMRMLGSLVGAALGGVLVNTLYGAGIHGLLDGKGSAAVAAHFADPQILVSAADQQAVAALLPAGALAPLIADARAALITGVHGALWMSVVLCIVAYALARRLPPLGPGAESVEVR